MCTVKYRYSDTTERYMIGGVRIAKPNACLCEDRVRAMIDWYSASNPTVASEARPKVQALGTGTPRAGWAKVSPPVLAVKIKPSTENAICREL